MELRKIILPVFKKSKKIYRNKKKLSFVIRSFIQHLFSDLSSAFIYYEEIPFTIKRIVKYFISDGYQIPFGYLTTFEFNRLEFNSDSTLSHMNNERRAMLVCFILFYRILILDIFRSIKLLNYEHKRSFLLFLKQRRFCYLFTNLPYIYYII